VFNRFRIYRETLSRFSCAASSDEFRITVANVNDAPGAGPVPIQSATEDQSFSFIVPGNTFADVDAPTAYPR
jgi:hypothetical protein